MNRMKFAFSLLPFGVVRLTGLSARHSANAQFPAQGTDVITSLGKFTIEVNPAFAPTVSSLYNDGDLPGYQLIQPTMGANAGKTFLTSPLLFDPSTTIARSAPITAGSTADLNGVTVGSPTYMVNGSPVTVANNNFTLLPTGWNPPVGTDEVHTAIQSMNLTGGGASVTAGQAIPVTSPNANMISYGEVVSNSSSGVPSH